MVFKFSTDLSKYRIRWKKKHSQYAWELEAHDPWTWEYNPAEFRIRMQ